jgi:hypothetical protein
VLLAPPLPLSAPEAILGMFLMILLKEAELLTIIIALLNPLAVPTTLSVSQTFRGLIATSWLTNTPLDGIVALGCTPISLNL